MMITGIVRRVRLGIATGRLGGRLKRDGQLVVGPGFRAARGCSLKTAATVSIGADCTLMAHLEIGPDVMVSSRVGFIGDDHPFQNLPGPLTRHASRPLARITLEGDNLIGFGAILVGPLTVGRGAVVGAGAVVTHDLEPDTVYGGVPARPIGRRIRPGTPSPGEEELG